MGCDRFSRFPRAATGAALFLTLVVAGCAQSVEDSGDPLFGDGGVDAPSDAGTRPVPTHDSSTSAPDTSTGAQDASSAPVPDAAPLPDAGGGTVPVDAGGGGPVSPAACPSSPLYDIEGLAELTSSNPRLCSNGCAATECCYGSLVCVNL